MSTPMPPVRAITRGPKFHWFGYYDKLQFDPTGRYVLGMEVGFEHRSPTVDDWVRVGMVDLADRNRWVELGTSNAWCWQQGCMLQWRPGSDSEVVWNDRDEEGRLVCHVLDVATRNKCTLPQPIYSLSPDGRTAVGIDFFRTGWLRPGYGYAGKDPNRQVAAPEDSGIYRMDLESGQSRQIISLAQAAGIPNARHDTSGMLHWFNHLLWSPRGSRFIFLHRCRRPDDPGGFLTRMFTASADGSDLRIIDDYGGMSHFIWRDPEHILAWARRPEGGGWGFYLFHEKMGTVEPVGRGRMPRNGHCTYLPGARWVLNDTYPQGKDRRVQELYLYRPADDRRVELAALAAPPEYAGEWRCDLHPRSSGNGRSVCIDSPHGGDGRQMHLVDLTGIVG